MHGLTICPQLMRLRGLIVGDFQDLDYGRDVIVKKSWGELTRIHETHIAFIPLLYPLLFPYGADGFQENIPINDSAMNGQRKKRMRVALREFIAFRIQERNTEYGTLVNSRRLFQQFVVDCYTMVEAQRFTFIRMNQKIIRCDLLNGV